MFVNDTKNIKKRESYKNLKIYESLYIKRNFNTVNFKIETNNINNIYDNIIKQKTIKCNTYNNIINKISTLPPPNTINTLYYDIEKHKAYNNTQLNIIKLNTLTHNTHLD